MAPSTRLTSFTRTHGLSRKMASSSFRNFKGGQMQTTYLQKTVLAVGSGIGSLMYPERAGSLVSDLVFTFGETTGWFALQCMRNKMMQSKVGREILRNKPRIRTSTIDLRSLRSLPDNTLGREYIRFMDHYGYSPDERAEVKYVEDTELAYVMQRYRELHDFIHTLLGMPTNVYGEIIVKQFEALQTGLPLCVLGGLFAPIRLSFSQQLELGSVYTPWAIRNGTMGTFFMNVYFERHLEDSIRELRRKLNLIGPPQGSLSDNKVWVN